MEKLEAELREKAKELLEKEEVTTVIGWGAGWNPAKASPLFVRDAQDADKLVFNPFCQNNLAVYLPRLNEKAAVITKPCDAGSVVALIAEGKIDRENVKVISIKCPGTVNPAKLEAAVGSLDDATAAYLDGDTIVVEVGGKAKRVPFAQVALDSCYLCNQENAFGDIVIDEGVTKVSGEAISIVPEDADSVWWRDFWAKEFDRCIRCYACREACPACYCRDNCAVQALRERWTGAKLDAKEALMFHAQRAMHVAGRCTECGSCERACPVGIPLGLLHKQVGDAVRKLFDFNVGEKADMRPPLETFRKEELESGH